MFNIILTSKQIDITYKNLDVGIGQTAFFTLMSACGSVLRRRLYELSPICALSSGRNYSRVCTKLRSNSNGRMRASGSSFCTEVGLRRLGTHNSSRYIRFAPVIVSAQTASIRFYKPFLVPNKSPKMYENGFYSKEAKKNFLFDYWLEINYSPSLIVCLLQDLLLFQ